ncbi:potassium channel family protein [Vibrio cholerae]|nr:two pore domain potassium channel family protein [Vibrio cholerae]
MLNNLLKILAWLDNMFKTNFFLEPLEIDLLKKIDSYNEDFLALVRYIERIKEERDRLFSDNSHPHNSHFAKFYKDIVAILSWYTEEGIIASDALGEYLLNLKSKQYNMVDTAFPGMASLTPSAAMLVIELDSITYNYEGVEKTFVSFAHNIGSYRHIQKNALYPHGCFCLLGFSFYNYPNFTNLVFENMILNRCYVINSRFSFHFDNCKLNGWKFYNSIVDIDRSKSNPQSFQKFKFLGSSRIEKLDIIENLDSDHNGLSYEVTEPHYHDLIKEAWFSLLYRYKPFNELGKFFTKNNINFFRALQSTHQAIPLYKGKFQVPYTSFDESFNPDLKLSSNSKLIKYIDWYKIHLSKLRRINNSDSSFVAIMSFLDVLITGSWRSLKYITLSTLITVLSFALLYLILKEDYKSVDDIWSAIYYSTRHFFNVGSGDVNAQTNITKYITAIEGLLGYFFLALIIYHVTKDSDRKH